MAAISRTKEYKALAERIRAGFRNNIGYSERIQKGVRYLEAVKAGREAWDAEKASGLARTAGTVYDRRRKVKNEVTWLTYSQHLELESMQNEILDVYGTSGASSMYTESESTEEIFSKVKDVRDKLREDEEKAKKEIEEEIGRIAREKESKKI